VDGTGREVVAICNFTPVPRHGYRLGMPRPGHWEEVVNTDAAVYGGSNLGNGGLVVTEPIASHGKPQSVALVLPPLGTVILRARGDV
jgi:1,4-alpha-glucan branching enzyme